MRSTGGFAARVRKMAANESLKVMEREFIVECIKIYKELPALWNVKTKEYYDRDKKKKAYNILLSKYREMFPRASKEDLKKKFNSLRTNYRKELKKHLQSIKSEFCTDDSSSVYHPTLWYFNEMSFLQDHIHSPGGQSGSSSFDDSYYTQEDITAVGVDQAPSTSYPASKTKKKILKRKLDDGIMQIEANHLRETPDEYQNWALSCAADLKKMEPMQQIFAKNAIAAIIMEGQLGLLHRNSVKINTSAEQIPHSKQN